MALYWCSLMPLAWIGVRDWRQRRITNPSLIILAATSLVYTSFWGGLTWQQVSLNLFIGLAITLPGYIRGVVGGGDVKLMVALAPLWPPMTLLTVFAAGTVATVLTLQLLHCVHAQFSSAAREYAGQFSHPVPSPPSNAKAKEPDGNALSGLPLASAMALGAMLTHIGTALYPYFSGLLG